ncbi:hypothetical protein BP6252_08931 [Coleophoma cylindrospora]|uniref:Amino acid transporter transmembrane domain-containing protein n=1 Tax=Coleophoma cylindrospora TaxID=1849047 RepID=A0A3D8R0K0_9HELO|nr:hypothetical protein BP6252_08931 [Coleophoma cylindrospora]
MDEKRVSIDNKNAIDISTGNVEPFFEGPDVDFEEGQVFKQVKDGVNFRTVGWQKASVIFLKVIFATGVLNIPTAMYSLGAVGGTLSVVGWTLLNTYCGVILGDFRNNHKNCHSIADMSGVMGGKIVQELVGVIFIIAYVLSSGSGILGVAVALNALSDHATCTVWFAFVGMILVAAAASVRKLEKIGWLTWAGFASIFVSVFVVVVAVAVRERPAYAPQTGPYELGYYVIAHPSFSAGMTASATIFGASAGTSAFLPVISEMKNPKEYRKALYACMGFVTVSYTAFSLVVYRYCGKWVTSPSLGSAGGVFKKIAYGIALFGLVISGCLYLHICAKYLFVRILRNSKHLQLNTTVHWATWLGCVWGLAGLGFVLSEAVPVYNWLAALSGSLCFAPLALTLPGLLWIYDHKPWIKGSLPQQLMYWCHWGLAALGVFLMVGGTYATAERIKSAYATGSLGATFNCADDSATTL